MDAASASMLGAAITAAVDDVPPRRGGVIDQFTDRIIEMMGPDEPHGYENCGCCQAQDYEAPDDGDEPLDVACVNCGHSPEEHEPA